MDNKAKDKKLILLDLFSGLGGFHKGLEDAGFKFKKVYYSEIDKHAIANYKYNFPNAKYIGSVTDILSSGIERPNIITFGSPCQDFSIAGKRAGLGGSKSSLIEYAIDAIANFRPDVFIWENVKGTFSSNAGEDFWSIIKAFADIGGYAGEWQLVNTSWILPQNRERIYFVGHLAESFRNWNGVFPIGENDEVANKAQREKETGDKIASTITASGESKLNLSANYILSKGHGYVEDSINDICPTIRRNSFEHNTAIIQVNSHSKYQTDRVYSIRGIAPCLQRSRTDDKLNIIEPRESSFIIRRLTEIECERLQGFPDNWTQYGNYNGIVKPIPKTQRYKMCGNAVTAKMVELIGRRIIKNFD